MYEYRNSPSLETADTWNTHRHTLTHIYSAGQTYGPLCTLCPYCCPVWLPPHRSPQGSGHLHRLPLLINQTLGGHYRPAICSWLSSSMPLERHCHTLSWISNEEAGKAATSSHIRINDFQAGRNGALFVNMHAERTSEWGWDRQRQKERQRDEH